MCIDLGSVKIDWTNFKVVTSYSKNSLDFPFNDPNIKLTEIDADEYFEWAKRDWDKYGDKMEVKTRVEVISNVKRAIDCKCETVLRIFGYLKDISAKNYPNIEKYIKLGSSPIISLISQLVNLNTIIVEEIRSLRNKTEHDYSRPSIDDVKRAISVGELFLLAINSRLNEIRYYSDITSSKYGDMFCIQIYKKDCKENYLAETYISINDNELSTNDLYYFELLRILITGSFYELPTLINPKINRKHIVFKEYFEDEAYFDEETNCLL